MLLSVIIPTIDGREEHFEKCYESYKPLQDCGYAEIIVVTNRPSCGLAWQAGAEHCTGDYIHLTCDDIVAKPGWHTAAIEAVSQGFIPAPRVYGQNGEPQYQPRWGQEAADWEEVHMTSLPFCSREQWEKIVPLFTAHYYTDDFFSYRAARAGWPPRVRHGYDFTHYWAQHKRGAGMSETERMHHDQRLYEEAKSRVQSGTWTEPWPEAGI